MPVDNRNFIIEDLPDDPEDYLFPGEDDDDDDEIETNMNNQQKPFIPNAPWQQQAAPATVWPPRPTPWITPNYGGFQQQPPQPGRIQQTQGNKIDRRKKIIFCDLLDVLIESESAVREQQSGFISGVNNFKRYGVAPRGLYDIKLKTEVWSKFAAFGADYIFCITNQPEKSEEELKTWKIMTDFVMYALADYLNLPHDNCKCLTKIGYDRNSIDTKPRTGLIKKALSTIHNYKYGRKDLVVVGVNSGYQNQSNVDKLMALNAKIDYVDVNELLTSYC